MKAFILNEKSHLSLFVCPRARVCDTITAYIGCEGGEKMGIMMVDSERRPF